MSSAVLTRRVAALVCGVLVLVACSESGGEGRPGAAADDDGSPLGSLSGSDTGTFAPLPTVTYFDSDDIVIEMTTTVPTTTTTRPSTTTLPVTTTTVPKQLTIPTDLLFDSGKAALKPEGFAVLQEFANELQRDFPGTPLLIVGFTDEQGTSEYNFDLSLDRAAAVVLFFLGAGVTGTLSIRGCGELPAYLQGSGANAASRRVQIVPLPSDLYADCRVPAG